MLKNRVKQIYESGQVAFGTNVAIPSPIVVELAGQAGLDFVRIDNYHVRWDQSWPTWSVPATTRTSPRGFAAATIPGSS